MLVGSHAGSVLVVVMQMVIQGSSWLSLYSCFCVVLLVAKEYISHTI